MKKAKTIHLHIFYGKHGVNGVARNETGKVINDNHLVKLSYGTIEWANYLKSMGVMNFVKVDVVGFYAGTNEDGTFKYDEVSDAVKTEVHKAWKPQLEVKQTPEQKRISELEAKIEAMATKKEPKKEEKKEEKKETPNVNEELEAARTKYKEVLGKKAHHTKSLEKLNKEIAEKLAETK